jgi:S1-C subfamily serine protease
VKIESVGAQTPAEAAGLRPGDVIVSIDGEAIADLRAYADLLRRRAPGDTVRIRFLRDGDEGEAEATLVER